MSTTRSKSTWTLSLPIPDIENKKNITMKRVHDRFLVQVRLSEQETFNPFILIFCNSSKLHGLVYFVARRWLWNLRAAINPSLYCTGQDLVPTLCSAVKQNVYLYRHSENSINLRCVSPWDSPKRLQKISCISGRKFYTGKITFFFDEEKFDFHALSITKFVWCWRNMLCV